MTQITELLILILLFGLDYYVYYIISLFKHTYPTLLELNQQKMIKPYLYLDDIYLISNNQTYCSFNIHEYYKFMQELQLKYRDYIFNDIHQLLYSSN